MHISLDYDETFTRDPSGFIRAVKDFRLRGHKVTLVTMRRVEEGADVISDLRGVVDGFVFTDRLAKSVAISLLGVEPINVWIDDTPFFADNNGTGGGKYLHEIYQLDSNGNPLKTIYHETN